MYPKNSFWLRLGMLALFVLSAVGSLSALDSNIDRLWITYSHTGWCDQNYAELQIFLEGTFDEADDTLNGSSIDIYVVRITDGAGYSLVPNNRSNPSSANGTLAYYIESVQTGADEDDAHEYIFHPSVNPVIIEIYEADNERVVGDDELRVDIDPTELLERNEYWSPCPRWQNVLANRQTDPFVTVETYPEPSRDGRINADSSDVAVYCRDGGVDVWNVYDGVGQYALYASQTQISQGLVSAISSGQNMPIASGAGGTGLWALASNELQVTLRDPSRPEYNFIMLPERCGEVNYSAQPISQPAATLSEVSAAAPVTAAACGSPYIVQRGDTLYRISRRCGVAVATILALNNFVNPDHIEPGQVITLP